MTIRVAVGVRVTVCAVLCLLRLAQRKLAESVGLVCGATWTGDCALQNS